MGSRTKTRTKWFLKANFPVGKILQLEPVSKYRYSSTADKGRSSMEDKNYGIYKKTYKGMSMYYCHYYDEYGKRYSRSAGCKTKAAANAWIVEQLQKGALKSFLSGQSDVYVV